MNPSTSADLTAGVYAAMFYLAAAVLAFGLAWRIAGYWRTPAPLKIPLTPAPLSGGGAALRVAREIVLFESLFKANLWTWALSWVFHASLALVLLRHLRLLLQPVPEAIVLVQPLGVLAGLRMVAGLAGLWARRVLVERIRFISTPSDHLWLAWLLAIAGTGLAIKFGVPTDVIAVKIFFLGLERLQLQPLPADPLLLLHLALVAGLMIAFPFSKLLHAPALLFSPTRNQADDSRERRHLAAWAAAAEAER